jgi:uncharacterized FlaG/YvyC family protein
MTNKLKTAIVFFPDKKTVWKLRNIGSVERFLQYGRKIGALYVNFYDKETNQFIKQIYF